MELQTLEKEWNIWQPIWKICILDHNSQKCIKFQCTKDVNVNIFMKSDNNIKFDSIDV